MSRYWFLLKTWHTAGVTSEADRNRSCATTASGGTQGAVAVRPPRWVGDAASLAHADLTLMSERMNRVSEALSQVSDLQERAAQQVDDLQARQRRVMDRILALGGTVDSSGRVAMPPRKPGEPLRNPHGPQLNGDVMAIDKAAAAFDRRFAQSLRELASRLQDDARKLGAIDEMNAHKVFAVDGALYGADWELDWDFQYLFDVLPRSEIILGHGGRIDRPNDWFTKEELEYAMREAGTLPAGIERWLYGGHEPYRAEKMAFDIYRDSLENPSLSWGAFVGSMSILPKNWGDLRTARFLRDGEAYTPQIVSRTTDGDVTAQSFSGLIERTSKVYDFESQRLGTGRPYVEVHVIKHPDRPPTFIAVVPGTTIPHNVAEGWNESKQGTDWSANVRALAFGDTSAIRSTQAAIELAVDEAVREYEQENNTQVTRPKIALAGHSQGGLIASEIAADRIFSSRYEVTHVVSAGSPVDHIETRDGTERLSLVNQSDVVPKSDGDVLPFSESGKSINKVPEVEFWDGRFEIPEKFYDAEKQMQAHHHEVYAYRTDLGLAATPGSDTYHSGLLAFADSMNDDYFPENATTGTAPTREVVRVEQGRR